MTLEYACVIYWKHYFSFTNSDKNDNTTIKICNDLENSKCMCGKCVCPTGYTGDYCECYNAGCGFSNNEICGGKFYLNMCVTND